MRDSETTSNFLVILTKLIFVAQTVKIWQAKMWKHFFSKSLKKMTKFVLFIGWTSLRWQNLMYNCAPTHLAVSTEAWNDHSKVRPAISSIWTHFKVCYGRWNISTSWGLEIQKQKKIAWKDLWQTTFLFKQNLQLSLPKGPHALIDIHEGYIKYRWSDVHIVRLFLSIFE